MVYFNIIDTYLFYNQPLMYRVIKTLCEPDDYNTESQMHRDFLITLYVSLLNASLKMAE